MSTTKSAGAGENKLEMVLLPEIFIEQMRLGQEVRGTFALQVKKLLPLRSGTGHYLAVVLGDSTGQIEGRVWENPDEIYANCKVGDVVILQGQVTEYNGKLQIQIATLTVCPEGDTDPRRFIPSSKMDLATAQAKLAAVLDSLQNLHLKNLLSLIVSDEAFFYAFITAPAAKRNHHATIGGLLEHSLGMAGAAEQMAIVYPSLDRDLLITGALLHDLGKVEEYSFHTGISFTDEGHLLGHIVLGAQLLDKYINQLTDFPEILRLKLLHMIVSHHGQYEWQSPKRPKFLEAAILHHLDMMDTAVDMFKTAVKSRENPEDSWTGWVRGLDRYIFCK